MRALTLLFAAGWIAGCSCSSGTGTAPDGGTTDATHSDGAAIDGAAIDAATNDGAAVDGAATDTGIPPMDGGAGPDGAAPDGGVPLTCRGVGETLCAGVCVNTQVDPANCGMCGHACAAGSVCLSSGCATTCPAGLTACGGTCVDPQSDNANCGTCGTACPSGQGCLGGACMPAVVVGPPPPRCVGGGPPIEIGSGTSSLCTGTIARVTFTHGLCACEDIGVPALSASLVVDAFDSTLGPYAPGGLGGHVGANRRVQTSSTLDVSGDLDTTATTGYDARGLTHVGQTFRASGPLALHATMSVDGNAYVGGAITGGTGATIGGALHTPSCASVPASVHAGSCVSEPVSIAPPCRCDASEIIPVEAIVAHYAMPANNDNAAIGLDPDALATPASPGRLDLPCGYYYLSRIHTAGAATIAVHGRTAVFVGGSIDIGSALTFALDPGSTLDVFVGGTVVATASFQVGSPAYPARSRFYVGGVCGGAGAACTLDADCCSLACSAGGTCSGGGSGQPFSVDLTSDTGLNGLFYAANGLFLATSNLEMYGAVFGRSFHSSSDTRIHYDRAAVETMSECAPPPPPPTDAGTGPDGSTSLDAGSPPTDGGASDGGIVWCRPGIPACGVGLPGCPAGNFCVAGCCLFLG
jgi:hypothetical protein